MRLMRLLVPASFLALVAIGVVAFAPVRDAWLRAGAGDDPLAQAELDLDRTLTQARFDAELDSALTSEDDDLAHSLVALAQERGLSVDEPRRARVLALDQGDAGRSARRFVDGFLHGASDNQAAFSGAIVADVSGFGDLRDLAGEGRKVAAGQEPDLLVVALASAGLAITAAAWSTLGAAMPTRAGVTMLKSSYRAGQISKPLVASLTRMSAASLDRDGVQASLRAAGRLDFGAARTFAAKAVQPAALASLRLVGRDASTIVSRSGARGLRQALGVAENAGELRQAARLATAKGVKTRAVLKVLGRGALLAASLSFTLASWIGASLLYLFSFALLARRFGFALGRMIWRSASQKKQKRRAFLHIAQESRSV